MEQLITKPFETLTKNVITVTFLVSLVACTQHNVKPESADYVAPAAPVAEDGPITPPPFPSQIDEEQPAPTFKSAKKTKKSHKLSKKLLAKRHKAKKHSNLVAKHKRVQPQIATSMASIGNELPPPPMPPTIRPTLDGQPMMSSDSGNSSSSWGTRALSVIAILLVGAGAAYGIRRRTARRTPATARSKSRLIYNS